MNLYPFRKGYYIYPIRQQKYFAQFKNALGIRQSKVFYDLQYAIDWLDEQYLNNLPDTN